MKLHEPYRGHCARTHKKMMVHEPYHGHCARTHKEMMVHEPYHGHCAPIHKEMTARNCVNLFQHFLENLKYSYRCRLSLLIFLISFLNFVLYLLWQLLQIHLFNLYYNNNFIYMVLAIVRYKYIVRIKRTNIQYIYNMIDDCLINLLLELLFSRADDWLKIFIYYFKCQSVCATIALAKPRLAHVILHPVISNTHTS